MKVEVVLEPERTDIQVTIHAPAATPEVEALAARLLAEESGTVLGFRGAEAVIRKEELLADRRYVLQPRSVCVFLVKER